MGVAMSNQLGSQALFLPEMQEPGLQPCAAFSFDLLMQVEETSQMQLNAGAGKLPSFLGGLVSPDAMLALI